MGVDEIRVNGDLRYSAWEELLPLDDSLRDYILDGVKNGFHLFENVDITEPVECENYRSALNKCDLVEDQIKTEILHGNFRISKSKPTVISSLGAIPKSNNRVRLIHDASRPHGRSLNSYVDPLNTSCTYMDLNVAKDLIKPGYFLAKVDLQSAYRSVNINKSNYCATGIKWTFKGDRYPTYLIDTKLPFGCATSPKIFQTLSSAVCRIMKIKFNILVIAYLDDFLLISPTFQQCVSSLEKLIRTIRSLGFRINWSKVEGPNTSLTFLGVIIDSKKMTLSLPCEKLKEFREILNAFLTRKRASKHQLEVLCGKLNWAAQVVCGGRTFLRRVIDLKDTLNHSTHKTLLTEEFFMDIMWWTHFLEIFNGSARILDSRPITSIQTDASQFGAGGYFDGDYFYANWNLDLPFMAHEHINVKEVTAIFLALLPWCSVFRNKRVIVYTDNTVAKTVINKGSSRNKFIMWILRHVFWLSAGYNFKLYAIYIPGKNNSIADACSRLHEPTMFDNLYNLAPSLTMIPFSVSELLRHMSLAFVFFRWLHAEEDLQITVDSLKQKAWAKSTKHTYTIQLNSFQNFCGLYGFQDIPASSKCLQLYIAYLFQFKNFRYATVKQYLNIISHLHKAEGFKDPILDDWHLCQMLIGLKRDSITPSILLQIKSVLNMSNPDDAAFWAACLIALFGLLRPNNVLVKDVFDPMKDLRRVDVVKFSWGFLLNIRVRKTIQFRQQIVKITLPLISGHPLCPVAALDAFFALTPAFDSLGPLICVRNGHPLTYTR